MSRYVRKYDELKKEISANKMKILNRTSGLIILLSSNGNGLVQAGLPMSE